MNVIFDALFLFISQITQQLEGICLQVIGLVLQKPIIGMAGVCARAVQRVCFVLFFGGGRGLPFQILSSSTFSHFSLVLDIASVPNFVNELILLFQVNTFLAMYPDGATVISRLFFHVYSKGSSLIHWCHVLSPAFNGNMCRDCMFMLSGL